MGLHDRSAMVMASVMTSYPQTHKFCFEDHDHSPNSVRKRNTVITFTGEDDAYELVAKLSSRAPEAFRSINVSRWNFIPDDQLRDEFFCSYWLETYSADFLRDIIWTISQRNSEREAREALLAREGGVNYTETDSQQCLTLDALKAQKFEHCGKNTPQNAQEYLNQGWSKAPQPTRRRYSAPDISDFRLTSKNNLEFTLSDRKELNITKESERLYHPRVQNPRIVRLAHQDEPIQSDHPEVAPGNIHSRPYHKLSSSLCNSDTFLEPISRQMTNQQDERPEFHSEEMLRESYHTDFTQRSETLRPYYSSSVSPGTQCTQYMYGGPPIVMNPIMNLAMGPAMGPVMGPVVGPVMGPVMGPIIGPVTSSTGYSQNPRPSSRPTNPQSAQPGAVRLEAVGEIASYQQTWMNYSYFMTPVYSQPPTTISGVPSLPDASAMPTASPFSRDSSHADSNPQPRPARKAPKKKFTDDARLLPQVQPHGQMHNRSEHQFKSAVSRYSCNYENKVESDHVGRHNSQNTEHPFSTKIRESSRVNLHMENNSQYVGYCISDQNTKGPDPYATQRDRSPSPARAYSSDVGPSYGSGGVASIGQESQNVDIGSSHKSYALDGALKTKQPEVHFSTYDDPNDSKYFRTKKSWNDPEKERRDMRENAPKDPSKLWLILFNDERYDVIEYVKGMTGITEIHEKHKTYTNGENSHYWFITFQTPCRASNALSELRILSDRTREGNQPLFKVDYAFVYKYQHGRFNKSSTTIPTGTSNQHNMPQTPLNHPRDYKGPRPSNSNMNFKSGSSLSKLPPLDRKIQKSGARTHYNHPENESPQTFGRLETLKGMHSTSYSSYNPSTNQTEKSKLAQKGSKTLKATEEKYTATTADLLGGMLQRQSPTKGSVSDTTDPELSLDDYSGKATTAIMHKETRAKVEPPRSLKNKGKLSKEETFAPQLLEKMNHRLELHPCIDHLGSEAYEKSLESLCTHDLIDSTISGPLDLNDDYPTLAEAHRAAPTKADSKRNPRKGVEVSSHSEMGAVKMSASLSINTASSQNVYEPIQMPFTIKDRRKSSHGKYSQLKNQHKINSKDSDTQPNQGNADNRRDETKQEDDSPTSPEENSEKGLGFLSSPTFIAFLNGGKNVQGTEPANSKSQISGRFSSSTDVGDMLPSSEQLQPTKSTDDGEQSVSKDPKAEKSDERDQKEDGNQKRLLPYCPPDSTVISTMPNDKAKGLDPSPQIDIKEKEGADSLTNAEVSVFHETKITKNRPEHQSIYTELDNCESGSTSQDHQKSEIRNIQDDHPQKPDDATSVVREHCHGLKDKSSSPTVGMSSSSLVVVSEPISTHMRSKRKKKQKQRPSVLSVARKTNSGGKIRESHSEELSEEEIEHIEQKSSEQTMAARNSTPYSFVSSSNTDFPEGEAEKPPGLEPFDSTQDAIKAREKAHGVESESESPMKRFLQGLKGSEKCLGYSLANREHIPFALPLVTMDDDESIESDKVSASGTSTRVISPAGPPTLYYDGKFMVLLPSPSKNEAPQKMKPEFEEDSKRIRSLPPETSSPIGLIKNASRNLPPSKYIEHHEPRSGTVSDANTAGGTFYDEKVYNDHMERTDAKDHSLSFTVSESGHKKGPHSQTHSFVHQKSEIYGEQSPSLANDYNEELLPVESLQSKDSIVSFETSRNDPSIYKSKQQTRMLDDTRPLSVEGEVASTEWTEILGNEEVYRDREVTTMKLLPNQPDLESSRRKLSTPPLITSPPSSPYYDTLNSPTYPIVESTELGKKQSPSTERAIIDDQATPSRTIEGSVTASPKCNSGSLVDVPFTTPREFPNTVDTQDNAFPPLSRVCSTSAKRNSRSGSLARSYSDAAAAGSNRARRSYSIREQASQERGSQPRSLTGSPSARRPSWEVSKDIKIWGSKNGHDQI